MKAVRDDRGRPAILLERSADEARLLDPETGDERGIPAGRLEPLVGPGAAGGPAADEWSPPTRRLLAAVDGRGLALLLVLDAGPRPVRDLLDTLRLCESDLHGLVGDLRAAGLVEPAAVGGERGYRATPAASEGLAPLRARASRRS